MRTGDSLREYFLKSQTLSPAVLTESEISGVDFDQFVLAQTNATNFAGDIRIGLASEVEKNYKGARVAGVTHEYVVSPSRYFRPSKTALRGMIEWMKSTQLGKQEVK